MSELKSTTLAPTADESYVVDFTWAPTGTMTWCVSLGGWPPIWFGTVQDSVFLQINGVALCGSGAVAATSTTGTHVQSLTAATGLSTGKALFNGHPLFGSTISFAAAVLPGTTAADIDTFLGLTPGTTQVSAPDQGAY